MVPDSESDIIIGLQPELDLKPWLYTDTQLLKTQPEVDEKDEEEAAGDSYEKAYDPVHEKVRRGPGARLSQLQQGLLVPCIQNQTTFTTKTSTIINKEYIIFIIMIIISMYNNKIRPIFSKLRA